MTSAIRARAGLLILLAPLLLACDSTAEPSQVGSLLIGPIDTNLPVGNSVQLSVTVLSPTGTVLPGHPVSWSSSEESVASVSAGGLVRALAPGSAVIRASAGGQSRSVTLTVLPGPCTTATPMVGAIALGQTRTGTLGTGDCSLYYGRAQGWSFQLASRTTFQVGMRTGAFAPDLLLTDRNLNPLLWSYWHADGVRLIGELPAGDYIVWAGAADDRASGSYELSAAEATLCTEASVTTTIAAGQNRSGTVADGDCLFLHGVNAAGFRLDLPAGTGLRVELTSDAFDALLVVTDVDMNVLWWDDDGAGGTNARIERRVPAGEYLVWATGYDAAGGGFQLSVAEVEIELCPVVGDLELGTPRTGTLGGTDCLDEDHYIDPWRLTLQAETTVRIDLTSGSFDTFLIIESELGDPIVWDDDGGEGVNARVVHTFEPGEYRVVATSWAAYQGGAYQLTATDVAGSGGVALTAPAPAHRAPWLKEGVAPKR